MNNINRILTELYSVEIDKVLFFIYRFLELTVLQARRAPKRPDDGHHQQRQFHEPFHLARAITSTRPDRLVSRATTAGTVYDRWHGEQ